MHNTEFVLDGLWLILQGVIDQRKFFFRYIDRHLKIRIPKSQSLIQKVLVGRVAVPKLRALICIAQALRCGRVHPVHCLNIMQIHISDLLRDLDQVIAVGIESNDLIL